MKKVTISISYDEEKLSALKLYLDQKQMQVEDELTKALMRCIAKMFLPGCGIILICDPAPQSLCSRR